MKPIHVLLIEGELSDARFVEDALAEIEETTHGGAWIPCRVDRLEQLADALLVLESEHPDIILFNPALPDSGGLATFRSLHDSAPETPLIALLDNGEEGLGRRMLRQGAQDFVLKNEIDCRPLARSMLNAIERQRYQRGTQLASATDPETGFYNADGFAAIAARDIQLARECQQRLTLVLAEVDNLPEIDQLAGREAAHELIMEAANVIRAGAGPAAIAGRLSFGRFAVLAWRDSASQLIARIQRETEAGHNSFAFVFGSAASDPATARSLEQLIEDAGAVLYENKQAYSNIS